MYTYLFLFQNKVTRELKTLLVTLCTLKTLHIHAKKKSYLRLNNPPPLTTPRILLMRQTKVMSVEFESYPPNTPGRYEMGGSIFSPPPPIHLTHT